MRVMIGSTMACLSRSSCLENHSTFRKTKNQYPINNIPVRGRTNLSDAIFRKVLIINHDIPSKFIANQNDIM